MAAPELHVDLAEEVQVINGFLDKCTLQQTLSQLPLSDLRNSKDALCSPWRQQVHVSATISASVQALCNCAVSDTAGTLPAGVAWGSVPKHRDWHVALAPAKPAHGRVAVIYLTEGGRLVFHGKVRRVVTITPGLLVTWDSELEHSFAADDPSGLRAMIGPFATHSGVLHFCIPAGQDWEDDPVSIQAARSMGRAWNAEDEVKIEEARAGIGAYANSNPSVWERLRTTGIEKVKEEIRVKVEAEAMRREGKVIITIHTDGQVVECATMDGAIVATLEANFDKVLLGDVRVAVAAARARSDPLMLITTEGTVLDGPDKQPLKDASRTAIPDIGSL